MKEIFFLFSVNQKLFTDTAIELLKNNKNLTFKGLAYSKYKYFDNVKYSKIYYVNEIIENFDSIDYQEFNKEIDIKYYEKKFNINFSELLHLDRHIIRQKKGLQNKIAKNLFKFIINYLDINKPSLIIAEGVDDLLSFTACKYCEINNLNFFSLQNSRIGNGLLFSDRVDSGMKNIINDYHYFYKKLENNNNFSIKKYDNFIDEYISNNKKVYYLDKRFNFKNFRIIDIYKFINYIKEYFHDKKGFHYKHHPLKLPFIRIFRQIKNLYYNLFVNKISIKQLKKINYYYYGLHVYPEAATLIIGRETPDQLNLLKLISKALPYDNYLIVKEHPHSIGKRDLFFYNQINKMHNVFIIDHNQNNFEILRNSKGLITISSSLSLESTLVKKPIFIFGDYYLNIDKNSKKILNFNELKKILLNEQTKYDLNSRKALIYAIQKNSIYLRDYLNSRNYTSRTIKDFAKEIINYYKF